MTDFHAEMEQTAAEVRSGQTAPLDLDALDISIAERAVIEAARALRWAEVIIMDTGDSPRLARFYELIAAVDALEQAEA